MRLKVRFRCAESANPASCAASVQEPPAIADDASLAGAFKTPGLRNVALRPPYMHAGQFATLAAVVEAPPQ